MQTFEQYIFLLLYNLQEKDKWYKQVSSIYFCFLIRLQKKIS